MDQIRGVSLLEGVYMIILYDRSEGRNPCALNLTDAHTKAIGK